MSKKQTDTGGASAPRYPAGELVNAAYSVFKTKPEVVRAALKRKQLSEATIDEANAAINEFRKKEVT